MTVENLYNILNEKIPPSLSCDWDNDGLMCCPDKNREVRKILVALDVTSDTVGEAISGGYDVIISHHPMIFHPVKALNSSNVVANRAMECIRHGIAVMSFHTRLDAVTGGVNDTLGGLLGLENPTPFGDGIGRVGTLPTDCTVKDFADKVKAVTGAEKVLVADAGKPVHRVAVLGGNGSDDVFEALRAGADTYVTGEMAYHHLTDAKENGINLIVAGHFHTENPVCKTLKRMLAEIGPTVAVDLFDSCRPTLY